MIRVHPSRRERPAVLNGALTGEGRDHQKAAITK